MKRSPRQYDPKHLAARLRDGDRRALARVLSLIENQDSAGKECVEQLFPHTGGCYVIGVTGAPGAGKSTLVDKLVEALHRKGMKAAVLAVDPSSPFTGGALLGDRIRMSAAAALPGVFIRSMASRGALGGLAPHTSEAVFALDAAGFDYVIIETVGVGQGEVEIVRNADTVVLALVPGMGDGVQALKAGIIEIADVFVINKSDYEGADRLQKELVAVMSLAERGARRPPIVKTVASAGTGVDALLERIGEHREKAAVSGESRKRKEAFLRQSLLRAVSDEAVRTVLAFAEENNLMDSALEALLARRKSPARLAEELLAKAESRKT